MLLRAQDANRALTGWERDRVVPMVTRSANPPTNQLYSYLGGTNGFRALNRRLGLAATEAAPSVWGLTHTTAADQLHLVLQVLGGEPGPLTPQSRARAWTFAGAVVPEQRWGVGSGAPSDAEVALKNGFAPSRCCGWRLNTAGRVQRDSGSWSFVILTDGWQTEASGRAAVAELGRRLNAHLASGH